MGIRERPGSTHGMPPLCALTHSSLAKLRPGDFEACARRLIAAGADVNATRTDPGFPDSPLSALYGAAGRNHLPGLTRILLDAGADPNGNESLYHSIESGGVEILRLLLAAGAKLKGTNALNHSLDYARDSAIRFGEPAHTWRRLAGMRHRPGCGGDAAAGQGGISVHRGNRSVL